MISFYTSYTSNKNLHVILDEAGGIIDLHQLVNHLHTTIKSSIEVFVTILGVPEIEDTFTFESVDILFNHTPITKLTFLAHRVHDGSDDFAEQMMAWLREEHAYPVHLAFLETLPLGA